jgi:hypothetical protein
MIGAIRRGPKRAQLQAAMALVDREIASRQRAFGVELYDLVSSLDRRQAIQVPAVYHAVETQMKLPLQHCQEDISSLQNEINEIKQEKQAYDGRESWKYSISGAVQNAGVSVTVSVKLKSLEGQIKQRKEAFGIEVFFLLTPPSQFSTPTAPGGSANKVGLRGIAAMIKSGSASRVPQDSSKEIQIQDCIESAHREMASLVAKRRQYERDIMLLKSG